MSVLSNPFVSAHRMRTVVSERILSWPPSAQRGMRSVCGDRQEAPPTPMASTSPPSTAASWGECRQPYALTAGRADDAQPVQVRSDVAIVAGRSRSPSYVVCTRSCPPAARASAQRLTRWGWAGGLTRVECQRRRRDGRRQSGYGCLHAPGALLLFLGWRFCSGAKHEGTGRGVLRWP
jgi:hypothetical protein